MIFDEHPLSHLIEMFQFSSNTTVQLSRYVYRPQSLLDERTIIEIDSSELSKSWLDSILGKLADEEELAVHSVVRIGGKTLHLPMVDFCCGVNDIDYAKECMRNVLGIRLSEGFIYYNSGRSMHAYGSHLLRPKEWVNYMGSLLLANLPNSTPVVDVRWIGHRIIGEYSSLRISNNSGNYLHYPKKIAK